MTPLLGTIDSSNLGILIGQMTYGASKSKITNVGSAVERQYSALPIRSPLGDQGLLRSLFNNFWYPILENFTFSDSNYRLSFK